MENRILHPCIGLTRADLSNYAVLPGENQRGTPMIVGDQFLHRVNRDGSFDSICMRCFQTIASTHCETALMGTEHRHECDGPPLFISPGPEHASATTASQREA